MTLDDKFTVRELFKRGFISINLFTYFRYTEVWESYRKQGFSKNKSYQYASDECGCSESTIRNAVRLLNKSIHCK